MKTHVSHKKLRREAECGEQNLLCSLRARALMVFCLWFCWKSPNTHILPDNLSIVIPAEQQQHTNDAIYFRIILFFFCVHLILTLRLFLFFFAFRIASLVAACTRGSCYVCAVCAHCAMQWHRLKLKSVLCARMRIFCNKLWKIMAATNLMHYPGAFVVVFYLFLLLTWPAGESGKCFMPCTSWHFSYFFVFSFFAFCPPYFCHLAVLLLTGNRLTSA